MPSRDLVDERLETLLRGWPDEEPERVLAAILREARADAPAAPDSVRERVTALGQWEQQTHPPSPRATRIRRVALAVAATLVLAVLGGAFVTNVNWSGTDDGGGGDVAASGAGADASAEGDSAAEPGAGRASGDGVPLSKGDPASGGEERSTAGPATLPPNRARAQDYRAYLLIHVDEPSELSDKTKRALALTRGYGGYVVRVDYASAGEGDARLELRVPIGRVQDAIVDFSDLGTIVEERVSIADLQGAIDARTQMLAALAKRIAEIRNDLAQPDLLPGDRQLLEAELAELRARAGALRDERSGIRRRASFARVSLGLTTVEHAVAPPSEPGGLEGTIRDAGGILLKELTLVLYVLIVAAPFLVAAALAYVGIRVARRRADERLLERA